MDPRGRFPAAGQKFRIAKIGELGIEKIPGRRRIGHAAADQQLGHHRRNARRALKGRDAVRIVRMDAPALGHALSESRGQESGDRNHNPMSAARPQSACLLLLFRVFGMLPAAGAEFFHRQFFPAGLAPQGVVQFPVSLQTRKTTSAFFLPFAMLIPE